MEGFFRTVATTGFTFREEHTIGECNVNNFKTAWAAICISHLSAVAAETNR